MYVIFFFKQKTAYEMRISDWSSDVCSSDLGFYHINKSRSAKCAHCGARRIKQQYLTFGQAGQGSCGFIVRSNGDAIGQQAFLQIKIGRASCRKECVSTCRSRWSPYHYKKNLRYTNISQSYKRTTINT